MISCPDMSQACHQSSLRAFARYFYPARCVIVSFFEEQNSIKSFNEVNVCEAAGWSKSNRVDAPPCLF